MPPQDWTVVSEKPAAAPSQWEVASETPAPPAKTQYPITPKPGEDFAATMKRGAEAGKSQTPQDRANQKAWAKKEGPGILAGLGAMAVPGGEGIGGRILATSLGAAGGSAVGQAMSGQGVSVKKTATQAAEYGAIPELAGAASGKAIELAGGLTKGLISRMMGVGAKETMFGKDPARAILKYKITAGSRDELLDAVEAKKNEVGKEIEAAVFSNKATQRQMPGINIQQAMSPIDDAKKSVLSSTMSPEKKQEAVRELDGLRESLTHTHELDKNGNVILGPMRPWIIGNVQGKATPKEALELKRLVGDNVNWQSSAFPGLMKSVQQKIYGQLRTALEQAVPGIKGVNQDYADLAGASQALKRQVNRETAGKTGGVGYRDVVAGGLGEIAGGTPGAAAAVMTKRALESTRGSTELGKLMQMLASSQASDAVPPATRALMTSYGAAVPSTGP